MYELSDLFVLFILIMILSYWWKSRGHKEIAYRAAKQYCVNMDLELLDQAVALRGLWFKRDEDGRLKAWRSYIFEFSSDGESRYQGRVITLGNKILKIELEPHTMH
ncbi:DUF3301 domain-containing protein [Litoribacillus peritrichatus]|mgnify:CR=1 FL=1|uniref:DUF3301 domain-containing protein n=1 Tax=Litoribacillus peritrichatus TaxID=718191 RepID=A0ABP7MC52_9GAMM